MPAIALKPPTRYWTNSESNLH